MKHCPYCGAPQEDNAVFCGACGAKFQTPAPEQPAPVQPEEPAYQKPVYTAPIEPAYTQPKTEAPASNPGTIWLVLNIVLTVLNCCCNISGIIGIIFGAISVSKYKKGSYASAKTNAKVSMILFIVGIVLGVLGLIISAATGMLTGSVEEVVNEFRYLY